jgi:hypothetical protein
VSRIRWPTPIRVGAQQTEQIAAAVHTHWLGERWVCCSRREDQRRAALIVFVVARRNIVEFRRMRGRG